MNKMFYFLLFLPICFGAAMNNTNFSVDYSFNTLGFVTLPAVTVPGTSVYYSPGPGSGGQQFAAPTGNQSIQQLPLFSTIGGMIPSKVSAGFDKKYGTGATAILALILILFATAFIVFKKRDKMQRYWKLVIVLVGIVLFILIVILIMYVLTIPIVIT